MIDNVFHPSSLAWRHHHRDFLPDLALQQADLIHAATRTLVELPDVVLHDIGIARSEIPFVARSLAFRHRTVPCHGSSRLFLFLREAIRTVFRNMDAVMKALSAFATEGRQRPAREVRFSVARAGTRRISRWL
jgi:hypothetical protein